MDEEIYEKYLLAGKISREARDYGLTLIKPDVTFLEVAEKVESKIKDRGADLSFPVNISVNNLAAHYSPTHDDKHVFKKGDLVKLDCGTHVDGYIADTAVTIEVETDKYSDLIDASKKGLETAIKNVKSNVKLSKVGKNVQETINSYGYKSIDNLTGHSLKKYILHSGISVPSVNDITNIGKLKIDDVIAIEPFATNGKGHVITGKGSNIYLCQNSMKSRLIRDKRSKLMFQRFKKRFKTLPFAERWVEKYFKNSRNILRRLQMYGYITHYPQLIEQDKGMVSQKEHTVIVTKDGCEVTT